MSSGDQLISIQQAEALSQAENFEKDKTSIYVAYGLYLASYVFWPLAIGGLAVGYINKAQVGSVARSHYDFQISTFWKGLLFFSLMILLYVSVFGIPLAIPLGIFWFVWTLVRLIRGLLAATKGWPVTVPAGWGFGGPHPKPDGHNPNGSDATNPRLAAPATNTVAAAKTIIPESSTTEASVTEQTATSNTGATEISVGTQSAEPVIQAPSVTPADVPIEPKSEPVAASAPDALLSNQEQTSDPLAIGTTQNAASRPLAVPPPPTLSSGDQIISIRQAEALSQSENFEKDKTSIFVAYGLYLVSYFFWPLAIGGLAVGYINKAQVGSVARSHYDFQISTFWKGLVFLSLTILLYVSVIGIPLAIPLGLFWFVWTLVRLIRGLLAATKGWPVTAPAGWGFGGPNPKPEAFGSASPMSGYSQGGNPNVATASMAVSQDDPPAPLHATTGAAPHGSINAPFVSTETAAAIKAQASEVGSTVAQAASISVSKAAEYAGKAGTAIGGGALNVGDAMADPRKRRAAIVVGVGVATLLVAAIIAVPAWNLIDNYFEQRAAEQRIETARLLQEAERRERELQEERRRAQAQADADARRQEQERREREGQQPQAQQVVPVPQPAPIPIPSPPRTPTGVAGPASLVDTATLDIAGTRVSLIGLVPVPHPGALSAARSYLQSNGGSVNCRVVGQNAQAMECTLVGRGTDIGEVFVLSGFATATPNAPVKIRQAEAQARQSRTGVWGQ